MHAVTTILTRIKAALDAAGLTYKVRFRKGVDRSEGEGDLIIVDLGLIEESDVVVSGWETQQIVAVDLEYSSEIPDADGTGWDKLLTMDEAAMNAVFADPTLGGAAAQMSAGSIEPDDGSGADAGALHRTVLVAFHAANARPTSLIGG